MSDTNPMGLILLVFLLTGVLIVPWNFDEMKVKSVTISSEGMEYTPEVVDVSLLNGTYVKLTNLRFGNTSVILNNTVLTLETNKGTFVSTGTPELIDRGVIYHVPSIDGNTFEATTLDNGPSYWLILILAAIVMLFILFSMVHQFYC